jgi:hypothetical protein
MHVTRNSRLSPLIRTVMLGAVCGLASVRPHIVFAHVVFAHVVFAHVVLAHIVLAHVVLAHIVLAHVVLVHVVLTHVVLDHVVLAHITLAHVVLAHVVLAQVVLAACLARQLHRLCGHFIRRYQPISLYSNGFDRAKPWSWTQLPPIYSIRSAA